MIMVIKELARYQCLQCYTDSVSDNKPLCKLLAKIRARCKAGKGFKRYFYGDEYLNLKVSGVI